MHGTASRRLGARQPGHGTALLLFALAVVLDGAFSGLQLATLVTGPPSRGDVYPGSLIALALTVIVTLVAAVGFTCEWRRLVATRRLSTLAVACLLLPALVIVGVVVAV